MGGFSGSDEWIAIAESLGINWWITSALEKQYWFECDLSVHLPKKNPLPQGLGTGALFTNNFETHLQLEGDQMWHKKRLIAKTFIFQRLNLCFQNVFIVVFYREQRYKRKLYHTITLCVILFV